jgi:hypothetical protein
MIQNFTGVGRLKVIITNTVNCPVVIVMWLKCRIPDYVTELKALELKVNPLESAHRMR